MFKNDPQRNEALQSSYLRGRVSALLPNHLDDAYKIAKLIKHPWFRCQALAAIAKNLDGEYLNTMIRESFASAMMCYDENRRIEVACWPLRVAILHRKMLLAEEILDVCMQQLGMDHDPISRWCAISVLDTIKRDPKFLSIFFNSFKSATSKGHGWRVERCIKRLINDIYIQKDQKYVNHLRQRKLEIEHWKIEHKIQKSIVSA